ncbi:hypothetical protein PTTG_27223 [Puccinia triticina 1-1 BBBD Race 1]|uniref:Uncharacterized protein n=1 Tax=Puccinia triticina (isolate 1-1 / race 1 (BBBD)) TaxID=630390 RepID=A0A180GLV1_PUCT1|nr:hypothetical protein PTTG_27223 [Puccinia triticina 1-1 BBBD Race 1]
MVGTDAVELDIKKEYPKLHPVFNVSLIVRYVHPNSVLDRGVVDGIKDKYYKDEEVVDWSLMKAILDEGGRVQGAAAVESSRGTGARHSAARSQGSRKRSPNLDDSGRPVPAGSKRHGTSTNAQDTDD